MYKRVKGRWFSRSIYSAVAFVAMISTLFYAVIANALLNANLYISGDASFKPIPKEDGVFRCTNNVQTYVVPASGMYKLEVWGAEGGGVYSNDSVRLGGRGGYSTGIVNLSEGTILYVNVGCMGNSGSGGFNGGGDSTGPLAGSGGGATDIRIGTNSLYARVIVAGGGGGAGYGTDSIVGDTGGHGGGVNGIDGKYYPVVNSNPLFSNVDGTGGSQIKGGSALTDVALTLVGATHGTFGQGGNGGYAISSGSGGGGGFYGGGGGTDAGWGGGGSGFIYTADSLAVWMNSDEDESLWLLDSKYYLIQASSYDGSSNFSSLSGSTEQGHRGNGVAQISIVDVNPPKINEKNNTKHIFYVTKTSDIDLESYVSVIDDVDGDITDKVSITSSPAFDKNKVGTYVITYNAKDAYGNAAVPLEIEITIWEFIKIDTGRYHTLALTSHGDVYTFGYGALGRNGLGNTSNVRVPTKIPDLKDIVDISAADDSSYAVDKNGALWAWGFNGEYRLGDGTTTQHNSPVRINPPPGDKYVDVDVFYSTGVARTELGNVYTWGDASYGVTGFGNTTAVRSPTKIPSLSNVKKVAIGRYSGIAILENGDMYMWGGNNYGQYGLGGTGAIASAGISNSSNLPTLFTALSGIKDICISFYHIIAIDMNGRVYSWGLNGIGRLGNGTSSSYYSPTLLSVQNGAMCSVHEYASVISTTDGKAYAWGSNNYGELGDNTVTDRNVPTLNTQVDNIKMAAMGYDSSFVFTNTGVVYGFGYGGDYVLGNGSTSSNRVKQEWGFVTPEPE